MNASKQRYGKGDLKALFAGATKVVVAKGKQVRSFDMRAVSPSAPEFVAAVLGPTGNLRAPAVRTGKTWTIGFNDQAYGERFG